ncbi:MAG: hypothetical protein AB1Z98_06760 [Nannocystaceae bacterium]
MARWCAVGSPLDELLEALQALVEAQTEPPAERESGGGNFRCEDCEDCSQCRFCKGCVNCDDCTYCEGCRNCEGCTHCRDCDGCSNVTHSRWSAQCEDSSYLTLCLDCEGCVQCFACVGLSGAEFCILNEKLPRKAYFGRVAALRGAIEEREASGWRPPWSEEPEPEPEAKPEPELEPEPEPEPDAFAVDPGDPIAPLHPSRTDITVDTGEPMQAPPRTRPVTPPWSFADARRSRLPEPLESSDFDSVDASGLEPAEALPEPPPYGTGEFPAVGTPNEPRLGGPTRDRYGWSAQAEGTPIHLDWPALGERAGAPPWPTDRSMAGDAPASDLRTRQTRGDLPRMDPRPEHSRDERPTFAWPRVNSEPPPESRADDLDWRRRETAANEQATPPLESLADLDRLPPEPLVTSEVSLDVLSPYQSHAQRNRLGPEDQTEPDAPVTRRAHGRAEISDAAEMPSPPEPETSRDPDEARSAPAERRAGLGSARRPERPRAPETARTGLMRGRAPTRPTVPTAAPAAPQPDAPSLRRARRPARRTEDNPTAPYPKVEPDDG